MKLFIRHNVLLICLLLIGVYCYGQKWHGYIVKLNGDTIRGQVSYAVFDAHPDPYNSVGNYDVRFEAGVELRTDDKERTRYHPNELRGFGYVLEKQPYYYESITLTDTGKEGLPKSGNYFVQRIETGKINVYKFCEPQVVCNGKVSPWEYTYLIRKDESAHVVDIKTPCNWFPDSIVVINYLGPDHPVSQSLMTPGYNGARYYLQQYLDIIHQYNNPDQATAGLRPKLMYCDTCNCSVVLMKKKNKELVEKKWMGRFAETGFYLYEGYLYNFKFEGRDLFRGILVQVKNDTLVVTNNFNKAVAEKENTSYDTLSLPLSSLEAIHCGNNIANRRGKNLSKTDYTMESRKIKGCPTREERLFYMGQQREIRYYFTGQDVYMVFEQGGIIYWVE